MVVEELDEVVLDIHHAVGAVGLIDAPREIGAMLGQANVTPSLCVVYEPRVGATYRPGANPAGQVRNAQVACQVIAAIWPTL